ncbi:MAG: hypothetical protein QOI60_1652 [Actinomycetota bacterium]|nr:hypothetical protein [Actinomycetota bacterium]
MQVGSLPGAQEGRSGPDEQQDDRYGGRDRGVLEGRGMDDGHDGSHSPGESKHHLGSR